MNKYDKIRKSIALLKSALSEMTTVSFTEIQHYVDGAELGEILSTEGYDFELVVSDYQLELVEKYGYIEDENCVTTGFNPDVLVVGDGNTGKIISLFCKPGLPTDFSYHSNGLPSGKYAHPGLYKGSAIVTISQNNTVIDTVTIEYNLSIEPILQ